MNVSQNGAEQILKPFTFSPTKHYVVHKDHQGRPRIFVITTDELPDGMEID